MFAQLIRCEAWVTRVFSTETDLTTIPTIAFEVRTLVQTFLNARASIFPKPQRPPIAPIPSEDSQESQEDYWHFDGYMDDPELLAVTGAALSKELQQREMILAEVSKDSNIDDITRRR